LFYFDGETALAVHPGDLAGGFSDLEMTWLLYCAGAASPPLNKYSPSDQQQAKVNPIGYGQWTLCIETLSKV